MVGDELMSSSVATVVPRSTRVPMTRLPPQLPMGMGAWISTTIPIRSPIGTDATTQTAGARCLVDVAAYPDVERCFVATIITKD